MRKHVVIVGAGGNIGSHVTAHVARMANVGRITLVDPDVYERKNLTSQNIRRGDVGAMKVAVQARRIRAIAGRRLDVIPLGERVEDLAAGRLRADVIVACLDSRGARQYVNETAWRLGTPWIDAGVEPSGLLARVNVYVPRLDTACLECAWDERDYAALEQTYPCAGGAPGVAPTDAPSSLGALAAALQAIECEKVLRGDLERAAVGRQVLIDALSHKYYLTVFRRNASCRLSPHRALDIAAVGTPTGRMTLAELFARATMDGLEGPDLAMRVERLRLVTQAACANPTCGRIRDVWRFERSPLTVAGRCRTCGGPMAIRGFDLRERLERRSAPASIVGRTLDRFGVRNGEIVTISAADRDLHYVVGHE